MTMQRTDRDWALLKNEVIFTFSASFIHSGIDAELICLYSQ